MAKRKAVKRKAEDERVFDCAICQDRKAVERNGKMQKCICVIKKEIIEYLAPFSLVKSVNKHLKIDNLDRNLIFCDGIDYLTFTKRAKAFMFQKFFEKERPYFAVISVKDYTEAYVIGETADYDYAPYVFLSIGRDNYNVTQLTTMSTFIQSRLEMGLTTWIYVYPNTAKSKLLDFFGKDFVDLIYNRDIFAKVVK